MRGLAIRCLVAVVSVLLLYALIPPVLQVIGFTMSDPVMQIFRLVVLICALYYIVWGTTPPIPGG
jgi:hypothetical protein